MLHPPNFNLYVNHSIIRSAHTYLPITIFILQVLKTAKNHRQQNKKYTMFVKAINIHLKTQRHDTGSRKQVEHVQHNTLNTR